MRRQGIFGKGRAAVVWLLLLCLPLCALLGSCALGDVAGPTFEPAPPVEPTVTSSLNGERYVAIYPLAAYEYFTDHKIGLAKAGQELGVQVDYVGPADNDIGVMKSYISDAITEQVDGIIVFGADDDLAEMIDLAWEAGIPCVTVDGDVKNSKRIAYVGTGTALVGRTLAELALRELGPEKKAQVAIITEPHMELHAERTASCVEVLTQYPGIEVVAIADTKANTEGAYDAFQQIIADFPNIDMIICTDYFGGGPVAAAVEERELTGQITIIAMDRAAYVLDKVREGVIAATLVQQTALMPYYAMKILYDYNHNPISVVPDKKGAGITGTPVYIETGVFIIDQNNYEYFTRN